MDNKPETLKVEKKKKKIFNWINSLIIALVLVVFVKILMFTPFVISGPSMAEALIDNERVIVNKVTYKLHEYKTGDIVVFSNDQEQDLVKRIIGVSGDTVEFKDNELYVNEKLVVEPYINSETANFGPIQISNGELFVMGDNRDNSNDSRYWGTVPDDLVVGKAFAIWMHWESLASLPSFRRVGGIE